MADALKRMQEGVEPLRQWRFSRSPCEFEGVVSITGFRIRRIISYRNWFLPGLMGKMLPRVQGGTRIEIELRMHWLAAIFMLLWAGVPVLLLSGTLLHLDAGIGGSKTGQSPSPHQLVAAIALVMFGYVLCAVSFNIEAQRARVRLLKMLDASLADSAKSAHPLRHPGEH
ncbi:MAG TPA: hypothetical protein VGH29_07860 [Candidatus Binataceae bacterium]